jgi:hypothetical protein
MKTYQITDSTEQNAATLPICPPRKGFEATHSPEAALLNFSYYTLCKISDAIKYTEPTPKTLALFCKEAGSQELTLDELGNFVSLKPKA